MTLEEKKNHVDEIISVSSVFDAYLDSDAELLHYRPQEDYWSIHEHIIHCMDVDIANFTRYRKGIVEPGSPITSMDEHWTEKLDYAAVDLDDAVETIKLVRKMTHKHLSGIISEDWKGFSFLYDKYGILDFETVIPALSRHPLYHLDLIKRNAALFSERQGE